MTPTLTVIDDFFPKPEQIRDFALEHDFTGGTEMDGHRYPGTVQPKNDHFGIYFAALLQGAIGRQIAMKGCAFVSARTGEFTEQWIHADPMGCSHAAVCYLFDGNHQHGTAFWRHRETGCTDMGKPLYDAMGADLNDSASVGCLVDRIKQEGADEAFWQMAGFTEARFNRLVFYPSTAFHSRYPREAFGTTAEDGRLVLVAFFTVL